MRPEDFRIGDRVAFPGFRDQDSARVKGEPISRLATFTRKPPCKCEVYEFQFDKGYTEHWSRGQLMDVLNSADAPVLMYT